MPADASGRDLQELARQLGLRAFLFRGSLADLEDNLRKGRPLIVMIPKPPDPAWRQAGLIGALAAGWSERLMRPPHWVVVTGLAGRDKVIIHDPAAGPLVVKRPVFEKWWGRADNLCLLLVRP